MAISVLIADDEKELAEGMAYLLEDIGYRVFSTIDGENTVALVQERNPDVLILDMQMPKKSGEDVLREMTALGLTTKVIVSTGQTMADREMKKRVLDNYQISAFLEKPSTIDEIDAVIKAVLENTDEVSL